MKDQLIKDAKALQETMVQDRRYIHQNPEIGMDTSQTAAFVKKRLEEIGCDAKIIGQNGVVTTIGKGGKVLLLRAELDGLPSDEENNLPFKSTNGNAHLCGHDMHTAMLLGVAKLLKDREDALAGTVKLMFQPGEEIGRGAKDMIENGILEDPRVDACFAIHVFPSLESGKYFYREGAVHAGLDGFMVEVTGKSAHSSRPEEAIDPLNAVANMYTMIKGVTSRESSAYEPAVCTIGVMGGGDAANIIPQKAKLQGILRAGNPKVRERLLDRILVCINAACQAEGASYHLDIISTPGVYNEPKLCGEMIEHIKEICGDENVVRLDKMAMESEDLSYISEKIPTMLLWMGIGEEGAPSNHSNFAIFKEDNMYMGASVLSGAAIRWLENNHTSEA